MGGVNYQKKMDLSRLKSRFIFLNLDLSKKIKSGLIHGFKKTKKKS
jgi:hypothetical protein